jgi:MFS family permease
LNGDRQPCRLGFYYLPLWTHSYWAALAMSLLLGIGLAGFVPLSALMPMLAPEHKGAAISVLNLGAGLSTFVGTAIVSLLLDRTGIQGIIWIFAGLYVVSIVLVYFMKSPDTRSATTAGLVRESSTML